MIKELKSFFRKLEIITDIIIIFFASIITNILTISLFGTSEIYIYNIVPNIFTSSYYYLILSIFIFFTITFLYFKNIYFLQRYLKISDILKKISISFLQSFLLIGSLLLLFGTIEFPIKFFILFTIISYITMITYRIVLYKILFFLYKKNILSKDIVIIHENNPDTKIIEDIKLKQNLLKISIVGIIDLNKKNSLNKFKKILTEDNPDTIFFIPASNSIFLSSKFSPFIEQAELQGKKYRIFLNQNPQNYRYNTQISLFNNMPSIILEKPQQINERFIIKRFFDILGGLVGLSFTILITPIIAILIKIDSKGEVFFKQKRVGNNGRIFIIYKFRTMFIDAEERKKELMTKNEMKGAIFKMENDPRITKIGKILRKFSLDEFPQFINVLKGEMSLVGTRPPTVQEVKSYKDWHHKRISIKPGLTGMWQVSGRNAINNFDDIVKLDIKYIDNWSLSLDFKIIIKTFRAIFEGE